MNILIKASRDAGGDLRLVKQNRVIGSDAAGRTAFRQTFTGAVIRGETRHIADCSDSGIYVTCCG
ncbi:hypothetical protein A7K99_03750 [Tatumella citrea]|uniref:Uncharacterized protein n=1 Tax=Tatumella citrea TaxID=53336 RepID=A0A1Y0LGP7_TATCI|nr:hypothetical protein A7K98_03750 [Tatumella citrea]ARU97027.1 hypothetical protein A7K99_03750 [Tatumella citrea]